MSIPNHVGLILDGNRRWAREHGLSSFFGHRKGLANVKTIIKHAQKIGIKILTVYAFSTENWNRSPKEVGYLMKLFERMIDSNLKDFQKQGVCFKHLGTLNKFPASLQKKITQAVTETRNNKNFTFCACLNYGGRDEIARAVSKIIAKKYRPSQITAELISDHLDTAGVPDPDMVIRTSGEQRLSGFLTWQSQYSELYFPSVHWPEFTTKEFDKAIVEYERRQRRFGH